VVVYDIPWSKVRTDVDFIMVDRTGDTAVVMVNLEGRGCINYGLKKQGGKWRIAGATFPGYKDLNEFTSMMKKVGAIAE
jgi:hypothetical protein